MRTRSGCHRWHSCQSDSGSYTCGDTGHSNYCGTAPQTKTYTDPTPSQPKTTTPTSTTPSYTNTKTVPTAPAQKEESYDYGWVVGLGILGLIGWAIYAESTSTPKHKNHQNSYSAPISSHGTCPRCGGHLTLMNGRRGKFYGCSNFRTKGCRFTKSA